VVIHNASIAARLTTIPIFIILIISKFLSWVGKSPTIETLMGAQISFWVAEILITLLFVIMVPAITAWHRLVLLGHNDRNARISYSVRSSEWQYLGNAALLILLPPLVMVPAAFLVISISYSSYISIIIPIVLFILVCTCLLRLSLVLPAAAVGAPMSFRNSWDLTRGNTWHLIVISLLTFFPFAILEGLVVNIGASTGMLSIMIGEIASSLLLTLVLAAELCVGISFLSWSYRYLVQEMPITLPDE
jgi:hypothetical protein